jgi:uncharacterized membrane protein
MHAHIFDQNRDMIQMVFLHLTFFIMLFVAQALTVFLAYSNMDRQPEWLLSSHISWPLLEHLFHTDAVDLFNASLPNAAPNKFQVSLAV